MSLNIIELDENGNKILKKVAGNSNIVDTAIETDSTWSSEKINANLGEKADKSRFLSEIKDGRAYAIVSSPMMSEFGEKDVVSLKLDTNEELPYYSHLDGNSGYLPILNDVTSSNNSVYSSRKVDSVISNNINARILTLGATANETKTLKCSGNTVALLTLSNAAANRTYVGLLVSYATGTVVHDILKNGTNITITTDDTKQTVEINLSSGSSFINAVLLQGSIKLQ